MQKKSDFNDLEIRSNFSAVLYVMSEQQSIIARLLKILTEAGILSSPQLAHITEIDSKYDEITHLYNGIYKKYAQYYIQTKSHLEENERQEKEIRNREIEDSLRNRFS